MWFYKSLCVLILAHVTVNVSAEYFVSNDSTDWRLATCNLAEPKLSYVSESYQVNVHNNVSDFWIGYQQAKIPFLFVSCGALNTETTYNVTNIGVCFNLCGGGPFAIKTIANIQTLECKCPNGSLPTYSQYCRPSANNICGDTCYSIYDRLNDTESYVRNSKNATEDCLTYFFPYFQWSPCKRSPFIPVMCSNYSYEDVTSMALIVFSVTRSWVDGNAICLENGLYPASPRTIMNSGFGDAQKQYYWTGVIRASTLLKKSSIGNLTQNQDPYQEVQFAFLTTNDATLQFAANGSKRALCLRETETTSMSPSTSSVQPANTQTQFSSTTVSTTVETSYTKEGMQDCVQQSKTSNRDSLAIGVCIGIPIGIILTIGGVVAIGVLRKRGVLHCGKITSTEGQSNQRIEVREEQNYEEMIDRNGTNESYCVLDRNVDSEEGTASYVNTQNDLNGTDTSSNYYNTGS